MSCAGIQHKKTDEKQGVAHVNSYFYIDQLIPTAQNLKVPLTLMTHSSKLTLTLTDAVSATDPRAVKY
jgi:hypothetical protein